VYNFGTVSAAVTMGVNIVGAAGFGTRQLLSSVVFLCQKPGNFWGSYYSPQSQLSQQTRQKLYNFAPTLLFVIHLRSHILAVIGKKRNCVTTNGYKA
jgi:hypothetical protein